MGQDGGTENPRAALAGAIMGSLRGGDMNSTWSDEQELSCEDL